MSAIQRFRGSEEKARRAMLQDTRRAPRPRPVVKGLGRLRSRPSLSSLMRLRRAGREKEHNPTSPRTQPRFEPSTEANAELIKPRGAQKEVAEHDVTRRPRYGASAMTQTEARPSLAASAAEANQPSP